MADPYRLTLFAGTPEHNAFGSMLELATEACKNDPGFLETLHTHKLKFKGNEDYSLLIKDYEYIVGLAALQLARTAPIHH